MNVRAVVGDSNAETLENVFDRANAAVRDGDTESALSCLGEIWDLMQVAWSFCWDFCGDFFHRLALHRLVSLHGTHDYGWTSRIKNDKKTTAVE